MKLEKGRHFSRKLTSLALTAALCASYLLVPYGVTAAGENYSCGLPEHVHTADCYQLTCGKEERFSHTHTKPDCYDEEGHLTCTLKEQTLHHHTQSCYSTPQPVCGLEESEEHTHTVDCYPADFQPQLICGQEDVQEHRHTADCYRLVCLLEAHTHTEACAASEPEVTEPTEETQAPEETEPTEETQAPEATEPTEETQAPEETEPTEETQAPEATEPTEETQAPEETEPTEETQAPEETEPTEETQAPEETEPTEETQAPEETEPTEETQAPEATEPTEETQAPEETEPTEETEPEEPAKLQSAANVLSVGTLTVTYPKEGTVCHLYRVGSMINGKLVLEQEFSGVSTADWNKTASVLTEIIRKTGKGTQLSQATVTDGSAAFSGLTEAVYLLMGDEVVTDGVRNTPVPFLTAMPGKDAQNQPVWDVQAACQQEETMDISVTKVWVGDTVTGRPTSITVHLVLDGSDYGSPVRLNYANHWSYTWEKLPVGNWSVREESSRRYTTVMSRVDNTFVFTSTWKRIPQTGQLWWPVAVMAAAGVCLLGAGLLRRRKRDSDA